MGTPAATITSMTAHGGNVILGFPQVMINFMPASRIGDMHVCPMVTGIVPHVGGPFILGAMTVLTGMMPQSRVTDQLTCVGPPDICAMGAETVLVGQAGAGGAGAAMTGVSALGASVPMQAVTNTTTEAAQKYTAELQQNGTIKTAAPGASLPPNTLSAPGWPDLPGKDAENFESAQPVDLPPGTTLYRVVDNPAKALGSYWTPNVPTSESVWRDSCAVGDWNKASLVAVAVVQPLGLKAWLGPAAKQAGLPFGGGGSQLWADANSLGSSSIFQTPWSAAAGQMQAAQQAMQSAQAAANQAQQAAMQGAAAAQQAIQAAQKQAQQAAQQAVLRAQQSAQQAQQAAQQAQQQAQQAAQQAQQAAQQAQQQAQQASQQTQQQAQQAAQQAQQQAQQVQKQSQQAANQAQQSANQAQQSAQQAQQALPKGGL